MSSFDLDTIRHAIRTRIRQGGLALSNPSAIAASLTTAVIFSPLLEGTLSQPLLETIQINVASGLVTNALYDFLKDFMAKLQSEEENQYSADEIRQRFEQALKERLEESGQNARVLRADVSRLLRHVEGIKVALSVAPTELRQPLIEGLIELANTKAEFHEILIEQSQLLVEGQQQHEQLQTEVRKQRRQMRRLEREVQEIPAKFYWWLLLESEESARSHFGRLRIPTLSEGEDLTLGHSPYKGLLAFQKEDADYFFGRKEQEAHLISQLAQDKRFLAVIGPSGSGKSSLVRAGLLSQLDNDKVHKVLRSRDWRTIIFKPGDHPLTALANRVGSLRPSIGSRTLLLRSLQDSPNELERTILQYLQQHHSAPVRLLLIVDQFEELFTRCDDESERLRFIESLLHVSQTTACRTIVLLTMRADFYGRCALHPRLREQIQDHHLLVGPLRESQLRRVIEQPARKVGLEIEPGLTETIIKDVADTPGALPLLSQALLETWKRRKGKTLTREGYKASGGVQQAIAQTANKVHNDQLTVEQQAIARQIFLRLVEVKENEQYDSRRRTSRSELATIAGPENAALVEEVLIKLVDARLIVTDQETVEVAHEALIRKWPTLRDWLDENREDLRIHGHLTKAAQEWERLRRDTGGLYRGARLTLARKWAERHPKDQNDLEEEFLKASQQAEEEALEQARTLAEEQRKRAEFERKAREEAEKREEEQKRSNTQWRRLAAALVVVLLVAVGAAMYATVQQQEAEAQSRVSQSQALVSSVRSVSHDNPTRGLLLAIEAGRLAENPLTFEALHQQLPLMPQLLFSFQHEEEMSGAQWNLDESRLLTLSHNTTKVWNAQSGQLLFEFEAVDRAQWNFDGSRLLTWEGSSAKVWDATSGQLLRELSHEGQVRQAQWNLDESRLLTWSDDGAAKVWDATSGQLLRELRHEQLSEAQWNFDESRLLTWGGETAKVWDATSGQLLRELKHEDSVYGAQWNFDESRLLTWEAATAKVWDVTSGQLLFERWHGNFFIYGAKWNLDESRLLTWGRDGSAKIWDVQSGQLLLEFRHVFEAWGVQWNLDGSRLLTWSADGTAKVWDAQSGQLLLELRHGGEVWGAQWNLDESGLLTWSDNGTAKVWDVQNKQLFKELRHDSQVNGAEWNLDESRLLTWSDDGTVKVWNAQSGQLLRELRHEDWVGGAAWNLDESRLLTWSDDGTAKVWNGQSEQPLLELSHEGSVSGAEWNLDESRLLTWGDGTAKVWDATNGQVLLSLPYEQQLGLSLSHEHRSASGAKWNLDESRLLTWSNDGKAKVWDATSGQLLLELRHNEEVWGAQWNKDESRLLTWGADWTAKVWDAQSGQLLLELRHEGQIGGAQWNKDESRLLTWSADWTAKVWDAQSGQLLRELRHEDLVWGAQWNFDESRLLTWEGSSAKMWDAKTGSLLFVLGGDGKSIKDIRWNADESQILLVTKEGNVFHYFTQMERLLEEACLQVTENLNWSNWQLYFPNQPYRKTCERLPVHGSVPEEARR